MTNFLGGPMARMYRKLFNIRHGEHRRKMYTTLHDGLIKESERTSKRDVEDSLDAQFGKPLLLKSFFHRPLKKIALAFFLLFVAPLSGWCVNTQLNSAIQNALSNTAILKSS